MAALLVMSCVLLIFGFAETGALLRVRIDQAPPWLGVIIPVGILTAMRSMPGAQRLPWGLIACGLIVGTSAGQFGSPTLSVIGWFAFGVAALVTTIWRRAQIAPAQHATTYVAIWVLLAGFVVAAILFLPPM